MPSSSNNGKREIHEWFHNKRDIETVIDVGCGSGTYPKLLKDRNYIWIGIEIHDPYIKTYELNKWYERVITADIRMWNIPIVDCIIFGDILEHLAKDDAKEVVRRALLSCRHIVISIPVNYKQEASHNNPYEEHKSVWTFEQINRWLPEEFKFRKLFDNIAVFIK